MKAERDVIESELKSASTDMKAVFLSALSHDGAIDEPNMSVETIGQVYGPLQKQVRDSLARQEALVSDIQVSLKEMYIFIFKYLHTFYFISRGVMLNLPINILVQEVLAKQCCVNWQVLTMLLKSLRTI